MLAPYWLFMLGGLFIGVTLLLPRGIVGTCQWLARSAALPDALVGSRSPAPRTGAAAVPGAAE